MRRITTPSFKDIEGDKKFTSPNLMAVGRGVGGVLLGVGMAANLVDPTTAVAAASGLAATDAEGSVIVATRPFPRVQKALRAFPSRWGRMLDPIADKVYAMGIFGGGMANGSIPIELGAPVAAMEVATAGSTFLATHQRGGETPEVGQVNKLGMIARMGFIASELGAKAAHGGLHDVLSVGGKAGFIGSMALGAGSMINILRQGREGVPEPSQEIPQ
jgi:hypothetical protein